MSASLAATAASQKVELWKRSAIFACLVRHKDRLAVGLLGVVSGRFVGGGEPARLAVDTVLERLRRSAGAGVNAALRGESNASEVVRQQSLEPLPHQRLILT